MNEKNKARIFGWTAGAAWEAFWIGIAVADIGKMSGTPEPYPWYLPLLMAAFLIPPFIFGFIAGSNK